MNKLIKYAAIGALALGVIVILADKHLQEQKKCKCGRSLVRGGYCPHCDVYGRTRNG